MINLFDKAEKMLSEKIPFDQDEWPKMIQHIRESYLLKQEEKNIGQYSRDSRLLKQEEKKLCYLTQIHLWLVGSSNASQEGTNEEKQTIQETNIITKEEETTEIMTPRTKLEADKTKEGSNLNEDYDVKLSKLETASSLNDG